MPRGRRSQKLYPDVKKVFIAGSEVILGLHHWFGAPADMKSQPTNTLDKPVLDQVTFQQLLVAAYTLQEQNDRLLVKGAKANSFQTLSDGAIAEKVDLIPLVSLTPEPLAETEPLLKSVLPMPQSDVEPFATLNDSVLQPETDARVPLIAQQVLEAATFKRPQSKAAQHTLLLEHAVSSATSGSGYRMVRRQLSQSNELFWRVATVVAMAAVSALLGASVDRLSPLPARLALPSEVVLQQVPLLKAKRIVRVVSQSGAVDTKAVVMGPHATTKTGPNEPTVVADEPSGRSATPASAPKKIVNRNRHSTYEGEADLVAQDTVVRYGTGSAAPRAQIQKQP